MGITIKTPGVSAYFEEITVAGDRRWRVTGSGPHAGHIIRGGLLADYQAEPVTSQAQLGALSCWGLPVEDEHPFLGTDGTPVSGVVEQRFERVDRLFDPGQVHDRPPGVRGTSYNGHLEGFYSPPAASPPQPAPPLSVSQQVAADIRALLADAQRLAHDSGLD